MADKVLEKIRRELSASGLVVAEAGTIRTFGRPSGRSTAATTATSAARTSWMLSSTSSSTRGALRRTPSRVVLKREKGHGEAAREPR